MEIIEDKKQIHIINDKKVLIQSFLKELLLNKEILLTGLQPIPDLTGIYRQWLPRRLSSNIFDSAINSGSFIRLSPENQIALISFYEDVKYLNTLGSNAGAMHFQELHTRSVEAMKITIQRMLESFDNIISQLEADDINM